MNRTAIKNFAIWARRYLREQVKARASQTLPLATELNAEDWEPLIAPFKDAENLGSLITPPAFDSEKLKWQLDNLEVSDSLFREFVPALRGLLLQAELLRKQYWVVVANPPFMGGKRINDTLKKFLAEHHNDVKSDLFSAFIMRNFEFAFPQAQLGFVSPFVWMFLSSYEKLREFLISQKTIRSLVKPSYTSFFDSAIVPLVTFVIKNCFENIKGVYVDLGYLGSSESQPIKLLEAIKNPDCGYLYYTKAADFAKIPGSAIAYWASQNIIKLFETCSPLHQIATPRAGMITGNNDRFIRLWYEISFITVGLGFECKIMAQKSQLKWFPYQKGGEFRRWYGNVDYVVNWCDDGKEIRKTKDKNGKVPAHAFNENYIFKPNVNWTGVTSGSFSTRITEKGMLFDAGGSAAFCDKEFISILGGFLNSHIANRLLTLINPSLNFQAWNIGNLPLVKIDNDDTKKIVNSIVSELFQISRQDWDNFETSWDFQTHPLLRHNIKHLSEAFTIWQSKSETAFRELQRLEKENNRYWIDAYGLQDELTQKYPTTKLPSAAPT